MKEISDLLFGSGPCLMCCARTYRKPWKNLFVCLLVVLFVFAFVKTGPVISNNYGKTGIK